MLYAKWKSALGLPLGGHNLAAPSLDFLSACGVPSLVLVLLISFIPPTCRYPPFLGPRHNRVIQIQQQPQ
jgi:hypothetical protein